jgi:hypothetical protein
MASFHEAALSVLRSENKPLHYREITRLALERGLLTTAGKTPEDSLRVQLAVEQRRDPRSPIVQTGPGTWALRDSTVTYQAVPRAAAPRSKSSKAAKPAKAVPVTSTDIGVLAVFSGQDVWVTPDDMRAILSGAGMDPGLVPDLDPVTRATQAAPRFRTGRLTGRPTQVESLASSADRVDFGILFHEIPQPGAEHAWIQRDTVAYDRASGWTLPATPEGVAFVETATKWQSSLDYHWLRDRLVMAEFRRIGAFSIGGGVYYVHADQLTALERLRGVVRQCGASTLHAIRLTGDPDTYAAVGEAAQQSLQQAVDEVIGQLDAWRERSGGRTSTLERMLQDLESIRSRGAGLADALRFQVDAIDAACTEADARVRDLLDESLAAALAGFPVQSDAAQSDVHDIVLSAEEAAEPLEAADTVATLEAVTAALTASQEATTLAVQALTSLAERRASTSPQGGQNAAPETEPAPEPAPETETETEPAVEPRSGPTVEEIETAPKKQLIAWCREAGVPVAAKGKPRSQVDLASDLIDALARARA